MQSSNLNSAKYAAGRSFLSAVEPEDATLVDTPGDRLILKGVINTGRGRMSGAKLDGGVEMMAACLEEENDNEVVY